MLRPLQAARVSQGGSPCSVGRASRVEQGEQGEQGEPGTLAAQPTAAATLLVAAPMSRHPTLFNSNLRNRKIENRKGKKNKRKKKNSKGHSMTLQDLITRPARPPPAGGRSLPASISPWSARNQTTRAQRDASGNGNSDDEGDGDGAFTGHEARQNTVKTGTGPGERPPCEAPRIRERGTCSARQQSGGQCGSCGP